MTLSNVSPVSNTRWAYSNRLTLFASLMSWQYRVCWRVQPSFFRHLRTVDEWTRTPRFPNFFWIPPLVVSSSFRIWSSMNCWDSGFNFVRLPVLAPFFIDPVILYFLMIRVTLLKLTSNSSLLKTNKQCFRTFIQKTNFRCELSMSNLEISLEISLRLSDISFENSRGLSNFRFDWNNRRFENSTNFERNFVSLEISLYFVEKYRKVVKFGEIRLHSFCTVLYIGW